MHYQLTIFEPNGEVHSIVVCPERPTDPDLGPGQWIDICRVPFTEDDFIDHFLFSEEICFV